MKGCHWDSGQRSSRANNVLSLWVMKDWFPSEELRWSLVREEEGKRRMSFRGIIKFTQNGRTRVKNLGNRLEDFGICFSGLLARLKPIANLRVAALLTFQLLSCKSVLSTSCTQSFQRFITWRNTVYERVSTCRLLSVTTPFAYLDDVSFCRLPVHNPSQIPSLLFFFST